MQNLLSIYNSIIHDRKKFYLAIIVVLILIIAIVFLIRRYRIKVTDEKSRKLISTLHPKARNKVRRFLRKAELNGIKLRIVSAYRSIDEQNKLYAQGRTAPGNIVTNAKGGTSYHNYGLAVDVIDIEKGYKADYNKIAEIAKSLGFEWGGDWKNFRDVPHFQYTFGKSTNELLADYNSGRKRNDYVII